MAEQNPQGYSNNTSDETTERGCFDFMRKKEEKSQEELVMTDMNPMEEKKEEKHTLMDELQRTHSHSSSSSEDKVEEGGERKKKKKGPKEAIKEKFSGDKEGEDTERIDTSVSTIKCNEEENGKTTPPEEKKGFIEKIQEKLPGHQHKKGEKETQIPTACEHSPGNNAKEKKGIIDMIKEKLPGQHKTNGNEFKED